MPRLLVFAVCQKAILDRDDSSLTIVGVFTTLTLQLSVATIEEIAANSAIVHDWAVATAWLRTQEDGDRTFEQRTVIVAPNGDQVTEGQVAFRMTHRNHNNILRNQTFPIGQSGEYRVDLYLREAGEGNEWQLITQYPIELNRATSQQAAGTQEHPAA